MTRISPAEILEKVAASVPGKVHKNIIVIGSLAVGYNAYGDRLGMLVTTKDIDCMLSPRIEAVQSGATIAETLLESGWKPKTDSPHSEPGNSETPMIDLPAIRLYPPSSDGWFIELLTVPESEYDTEKNWTRIELSTGHYGLCSFRFLSLTAFEPVKTKFGIYCARSDMMALANLLEHPEIKPDRMSTPIGGQYIKRFPADFMFELNIHDIDTMVSQNVIPSKQVLGGAKPFVFTEQGVANLSSILNSFERLILDC